ncbi:hypothetical protein EB796_016514 [Bugula neritina]|uniref:Uncharacterized protein n=1 Tax=Bugula neritina TaxID=10212 RepID=A0A7J7JHD2_BUGNE|nr:hypothetical protein EB796_016514 [Bugula neritina]
MILAAFTFILASKRHLEYGSPMIRALVSSIYKHACHRDLYTIFKQVSSIELVNNLTSYYLLYRYRVKPVNYMQMKIQREEKS